MVAIIDYGVGNLFSLRSSFAAIGEQAEVTGDAARIAQADRVILPASRLLRTPMTSSARAAWTRQCAAR